VLPVPLHPVRHSARGFNQSVEVGRWIARRLQLNLDPCLAVRRRDTRPQVGLAVEERQGNLADAFVASTAARGLRVALVDDVTTTGRTLQELAGTLVEAGARSVTGWCVARADLRKAATPESPPAAKPV
jgi:predicted amidophosphoribosyltransferase